MTNRPSGFLRAQAPAPRRRQVQYPGVPCPCCDGRLVDASDGAETGARHTRPACGWYDDATGVEVRRAFLAARARCN